MGGAVSVQTLSAHRKLLVRLTGPSPIEYSDTFWLRLGVFPVQLTSLDPVEVDRFLGPFYQQLAVNSRTTHNYHKLVLRVIGTVGVSREPDPLLLAANSICLLRYLTKGLLEILPGPEFFSFLDGHPLGLAEANQPQADEGSLLKRLVEAMVDVVVNNDCDDNGYIVKLEAILLLLTGCSTQLFTTLVTAEKGTHPVTDMLMSRSDISRSLFQTLINWFVQRPQVPPGIVVYRKSSESQRTVTRYMRQAADTVLWLPRTAYQLLVGAGQETKFSPLADSSQLLLLALVAHATPQSEPNPFRTAVKELHDVAYLGGVESSLPGGHLTANPSVSFGALFDTLGQTLTDERSTLLLYHLLLSCQSFREYVLVRSDLETLIIPALKLMYQVKLQNQSQLYLLSIILLVLSQDASFCSNSHRIMINGPDWYKERPLGQTSLGSLLMIILLRTAQQNFAKMHDVYLHTNTIAAFTNIAGAAAGLSSYAAQRLLLLVELLAKKQHKTNVTLGPGSMDFANEATQQQFLSDFLRILLEVTNGIITTNLLGNPELVYAILHRQDTLETLEQIPQYTDVLQNIKAVPSFFNARIDEAKALQPGVDWSVDRVLDVIRTSSRSWRNDRLRPFPELKFSYEEEQSPEEFFVPLVWSLVVMHSPIPWNTVNTILLTSMLETAPSLDSDSVSLDIPPSSSHSRNGVPSRISAQEIVESP